MNIKYYHFHLYYKLEEITLASEVAEKISKAFDVEVGRLWEKPVGPHPICSCQVSVPVELFEKVTAWFLENRKGIDLFIHPVTGDDFTDHTESIMWIGKSYILNTDMFSESSK